MTLLEIIEKIIQGEKIDTGPITVSISNSINFLDILDAINYIDRYFNERDRSNESTFQTLTHLCSLLLVRLGLRFPDQYEALKARRLIRKTHKPPEDERGFRVLYMLAQSNIVGAQLILSEGYKFKGYDQLAQEWLKKAKDHREGKIPSKFFSYASKTSLVNLNPQCPHLIKLMEYLHDEAKKGCLFSELHYYFFNQWCFKKRVPLSEAVLTYLPACVMRGISLIENNSTLQKGLSLFTKAKEAGNIGAEFLLVTESFWSDTHSYDLRDWKYLIDTLFKTAQQGHAIAQYYIGVLIYYSNEEEISNHWITQSKDQNYPFAEEVCNHIALRKKFPDPIKLDDNFHRIYNILRDSPHYSSVKKHLLEICSDEAKHNTNNKNSSADSKSSLADSKASNSINTSEQMILISLEEALDSIFAKNVQMTPMLLEAINNTIKIQIESLHNIRELKRHLLYLQNKYLDSKTSEIISLASSLLQKFILRAKKISPQLLVEMGRTILNDVKQSLEGCKTAKNKGMLKLSRSKLTKCIYSLNLFNNFYLMDIKELDTSLPKLFDELHTQIQSLKDALTEKKQNASVSHAADQKASPSSNDNRSQKLNPESDTETRVSELIKNTTTNTIKTIQPDTTKDTKQDADKDTKLEADKDTKQDADKDTKLEADKDTKLDADKDTKLEADKDTKLDADKDTKLEAAQKNQPDKVKKKKKYNKNRKKRKNPNPTCESLQSSSQSDPTIPESTLSGVSLGTPQSSTHSNNDSSDTAKNPKDSKDFNKTTNECNESVTTAQENNDANNEATENNNEATENNNEATENNNEATVNNNEATENNNEATENNNEATENNNEATENNNEETENNNEATENNYEATENNNGVNREDTEENNEANIENTKEKNDNKDKVEDKPQDIRDQVIEYLVSNRSYSFAEIKELKSLKNKPVDFKISDYSKLKAVFKQHDPKTICQDLLSIHSIQLFFPTLFSLCYKSSSDSDLAIKKRRRWFNQQLTEINSKPEDERFSSFSVIVLAIILQNNPKHHRKQWLSTSWLDKNLTNLPESALLSEITNKNKFLLKKINELSEHLNPKPSKSKSENLAEHPNQKPPTIGEAASAIIHSDQSNLTSQSLEFKEQNGKIEINEYNAEMDNPSETAIEIETATFTATDTDKDEALETEIETTPKIESTAETEIDTTQQTESNAQAPFPGSNAPFIQAAIPGPSISFGRAHFQGQNVPIAHPPFTGQNVPIAQAPFTGHPIPFSRAPFPEQNVPIAQAPFTGHPIPFSRAPFPGQNVPIAQAPFTGHPIPFSRAPFQGQNVPIAQAPFTGHPIPFSRAPFPGQNVPIAQAPFTGHPIPFSRAPFPGQNVPIAQAPFTDSAPFVQASLPRPQVPHVQSPVHSEQKVPLPQNPQPNINAPIATSHSPIFNPHNTPAHQDISNITLKSGEHTGLPSKDPGLVSEGDESIGSYIQQAKNNPNQRYLKIEAVRYLLKVFNDQRNLYKNAEAYFFILKGGSAKYIAMDREPGINFDFDLATDTPAEKFENWLDSSQFDTNLFYSDKNERHLDIKCDPDVRINLKRHMNKIDTAGSAFCIPINDLLLFLGEGKKLVEDAIELPKELSKIPILDPTGKAFESLKANHVRFLSDNNTDRERMLKEDPTTLFRASLEAIRDNQPLEIYTATATKVCAKYADPKVYREYLQENGHEETADKLVQKYCYSLKRIFKKIFIHRNDKVVEQIEMLKALGLFEVFFPEIVISNRALSHIDSDLQKTKNLPSPRLDIILINFVKAAMFSVQDNQMNLSREEILLKYNNYFQLNIDKVREEMRKFPDEKQNFGHSSSTRTLGMSSTSRILSSNNRSNNKYPKPTSLPYQQQSLSGSNTQGSSLVRESASFIAPFHQENLELSRSENLPYHPFAQTLQNEDSTNQSFGPMPQHPVSYRFPQSQQNLALIPTQQTTASSNQIHAQPIPNGNLVSPGTTNVSNAYAPQTMFHSGNSHSSQMGNSDFRNPSFSSHNNHFYLRHQQSKQQPPFRRQ